MRWSEIESSYNRSETLFKNGISTFAFYEEVGIHSVLKQVWWDEVSYRGSRGKYTCIEDEYKFCDRTDALLYRMQGNGQVYLVAIGNVFL